MEWVILFIEVAAAVAVAVLTEANKDGKDDD
jgi:hypothetical protein